MVHLASHPCWF